MGVLDKMLGSKSNRDIKAIQPLVGKILEAEKQISGLSDNDLRGKTQEFRQRINDHIREEEQKVNELRQSIESEDDIMEREKIWEQVDKLEKAIYDKTQDKLNDILPEAFAVMKETARRFKENGSLEVIATDLDKQLAPVRDGMEIVGENAIFKNEWTAGGTLITWD